MSIVIRRENGDILWFDAVKTFSENYSATVTKHPIATGGFVSDHTTTDNVVLNISAVLSDADFNLSRTVVDGKDTSGKSITPNKQFTNYTTTAIPVTVTDVSIANKLLPEIISQFTKDSIPVAIVTPQEKAKTAIAVKQEMIKMWKDKENFQVLDIDANSVTASFGPCVFTNIVFNEDDSTGYGVFPTMTIEQVVYVDVQNTKVQIKTSNKGRKSGTSTNSNAGQDDDTSGGPKSYTKVDESALHNATSTVKTSK